MTDMLSVHSNPESPVPKPFSLHPQLEADTFYVGDLTLSRVMLMNNAHFPWAILVPRASYTTPPLRGSRRAGGDAVGGQEESPPTPQASPSSAPPQGGSYITELFDLTHSDQQQFLKEISFVSETMNKIFSADKMNIAMLGNQVPQLHCHIIARFKSDKAWPNPVWGAEALKYPENQKEEELAKLSSMFVSRLAC